ncbi:MAG: AAA family ATPase, partial [Candidatus Aenigmatarchaeota archaeon]
MIRKIILKNWKSHLNSTLNFEKGVNLLVGNIGAGKSSVLDGICFALYGTIPEIQARRIKVEELIMRKPFEKDEAEVYLEFEANNKILSVKRVLRKGRSSYAEFRENGKLLEVQSSQRVTELVEKELKTSYELFSKIIYAEQNSLDYFLRLAPNERKKKIDELLMIERFERARASCSSLINRIEAIVKDKEKYLASIDFEKLKRELEEIGREIERLSIEISSKKIQLSDITSRRILIEEEYRKLREVKEKLESKKKDAKSLKLILEEI